MDYYFVKGVAVGFAIAAPVGPVGLLCIRRALADGRVAAWVAGLGAAVADTFYGAVAGLGLNLVSDFLFDHRTLLSVVGGPVPFGAWAAHFPHQAYTLANARSSQRVVARLCLVVHHHFDQPGDYPRVHGRFRLNGRGADHR